MMAEQRTARPVSGEIMTGTSVGPELRPEATTSSTQTMEVWCLVPRAEAVSSLARGIVHAVDRRHGHAAQAGSRNCGCRDSRGGPIFWIAGVGAALPPSGSRAATRWSARSRSGQPNSRRALYSAIAGVTSRVDASGAPVLFVDGEAVNDGAKAGQSPPLEIRVTGNDSHVPATRWGHPTVRWHPAKDLAFPAGSTRLETG